MFVDCLGGYTKASKETSQARKRNEQYLYNITLGKEPLNCLDKICSHFSSKLNVSKSNSWIHFSYVVELARALANTKGDHRVDLLTRQIASPLRRCLALSKIVAVAKPLSSASPVVLAISNNLGMIQAFTLNIFERIALMALGEQVNGGKPTWPHVIHGHYTDPREVAAHVSSALIVPMVLIGHSLGRNKFEQLLERGRLPEDINATHKMMKRIDAEEMGLDATEMVVTSTRQGWWIDERKPSRLQPKVEMKLGAYQSLNVLDSTHAKRLKREVSRMTMTTKVSSTLGRRKCHTERLKQKKVGRVVNSKILTSGRKEVLEKMNLRKKMRDSNMG
ncbi:hypothetical protein Patl1_19746 [Pistacia atlantica]|uniref:Uncharacterized protein n=1 Tax=Pistacia atlantica TaxID=434234 RepID=A0ACC1BMT9_9ROSI|nr:hypothetical protein Patl1_19746 [Pistacia atlantica]